MKDEHGNEINYSTFPNEIDRKRDEIELSPQVRRVLGEILRKTIGFTRNGKKSWGHELSPNYISKSLGTNGDGKPIVPRSTVQYAYKILEKRKIISTRITIWEEDPKKKITWVEVNRNTNEWV
jgi:hypothetical protein